MKFLKSLFYFGAGLSLLMLPACNDDDTADSSRPAELRFHLTDAPADYDAVLVDIQEVRVHIGDEENSDSEGWVTMDDIRPGVYDLLELRNGLDTVLAEGEVPAGRITQIRLMLGEENSVVVDGTSHYLKTPSAQQSGLKLQVNYELEPGLYYEFWIDFDASRSIVEKGNGGYNLKPVIRVFTENTTGSIEGYIDPASAQPEIMAYDVADTAFTRADSLSGYFLLKGLNPGTYTVEVDAGASFNDTTLTGVDVTEGAVTDLDTLRL